MRLSVSDFANSMHDFIERVYCDSAKLCIDENGIVKAVVISVDDLGVLCEIAAGSDRTARGLEIANEFEPILEEALQEDAYDAEDIANAMEAEREACESGEEPIPWEDAKRKRDNGG